MDSKVVLSTDLLSVPVLPCLGLQVIRVRAMSINTYSISIMEEDNVLCFRTFTILHTLILSTWSQVLVERQRKERVGSDDKH